MKFNLKSFVAGSVMMATLMLAPTALKAQEAPQSLPTFPALEQLDLSPEQEADLAQIRVDTRTQLESLISPEQREQFVSTLQAGDGFRQAIAAANLTEDQRTQVRSILRSAREEAAAVLTPAQRQQVREFVQQRVREFRE